MDIAGLIAVRAGSERVKDKNIRPFAGSTLLERKIAQLMTCRGLCAVIVNSDSAEMLDIAERMGAIPVRRRPEMAASNAPMSEVYASMAEDCPYPGIAYCNATSPLIKSETIEECLRVFQHDPRESVNTVAPVREFMWMHGNPVNYDPRNQPRSQDLPPIVRITFAASIIRREDMIRLRQVVSLKPRLIITSDVEAVDIDTPLDFEWAEYLAKRESNEADTALPATGN